MKTINDYCWQSYRDYMESVRMLLIMARKGTVSSVIEKIAFTLGVASAYIDVIRAQEISTDNVNKAQGRINSYAKALQQIKKR